GQVFKWNFSTANYPSAVRRRAGNFLPGRTHQRLAHLKNARLEPNRVLILTGIVNESQKTQRRGSSEPVINAELYLLRGAVFGFAHTLKSQQQAAQCEPP